MKRFNDINADNASEYYQAFEAAQEQSVQWLIDYLSINHHIDIESFDYSRDSLIPIWGAIKNNIEFVIEYGNSKPLMGSKYLEKQRSKPLNTSNLPIWYEQVFCSEYSPYFGPTENTAFLMDGLNAYYTACLKNAMPDSFTSLIDAPNTAYHYYPSLHRDINDKIGECILSHVVAICCNAVLEKKGLEDDRFAKRFDIDILDKAKVFGIDLHEPPITLRKDKNAPEGYNLTLTLSDEVAHEASKITDFAHNLRELPEIDEVIYEDKELLYISSSHTTAKVKKAVKTLLQSLGIEI